MFVKTSDYIAQFLSQRKAKHIFAISGAGNVHLLNSIAHHPELIYVCPHHEQAGVMASLAYHRISGRPGIMITTSGAGASNAITGALDAWADSIPCVIISGQERSSYARADNPLRMWGVQGMNISAMVKGITKYSAIVNDPYSVRYHLEKAFHLSSSGRPGPVWLDIPADVQAAPIDPERMVSYLPETPPEPDVSQPVTQILDWLAQSQRPVFLIGHGVRLAGAADLVPALMQQFSVPFLTAWNGADLISTRHPRHYGHAGNYGQRCANFVVQNCDFLVTIGTRLAIPQIGYEFAEFARTARKVIVDIDPTELTKFGHPAETLLIQADARHFITTLLVAARGRKFAAPAAWLNQCNTWRERYPLVDPSMHVTKPGTVNSYDFIYRLSQQFAPNEIVVTDMGTALTCTHQAIVLDHQQRLVTSTGLGEMGFGLPGAIGACLASERQRIVFITGDGSIMLNLQEFQTVAHHRLPIKMFLYTNDGYLTIRHTEQSLFGPHFSATGAENGVSCPDFIRLAEVFGFSTFHISGSEDIEAVAQQVLETEGLVLCIVSMDPMQPLVPKLSFAQQADGTLVSPPIEDLYPFLSRDELREQMLVGLHPKSEAVTQAGLQE
jgi:acetolactate synthase I/II/III large subunit